MMSRDSYVVARHITAGETLYEEEHGTNGNTTATRRASRHCLFGDGEFTIMFNASDVTRRRHTSMKTPPVATAAAWKSR